MLIDVNIKADTSELLDEMLRVAHALDFDAVAISTNLKVIAEETPSIPILSRTDITSRTLQGIKTQAGQHRKHSLIVALPLRGVLTANWAAEDSRVDLLTLQVDRTQSRLRRTTARLAAENQTTLEICIDPLLHSDGLQRSRIIKTCREAVSVALDAGMSILLSSGASHPLSLRSPKALQFIGTVLGMRLEEAGKAALEMPGEIVSRNRHKMSEGYIAHGLEIIKEGK